MSAAPRPGHGGKALSGSAMSRSALRTERPTCPGGQQRTSGRPGGDPVEGARPHCLMLWKEAEGPSCPASRVAAHATGPVGKTALKTVTDWHKLRSNTFQQQQGHLPRCNAYDFSISKGRDQVNP